MFKRMLVDFLLMSAVVFITSGCGAPVAKPEALIASSFALVHMSPSADGVYRQAGNNLWVDVWTTDTNSTVSWEASNLRFVNSAGETEAFVPRDDLLSYISAVRGEGAKMFSIHAHSAQRSLMFEVSAQADALLGDGTAAVGQKLVQTFCIKD